MSYVYDLVHDKEGSENAETTEVTLIHDNDVCIDYGHSRSKHEGTKRYYQLLQDAKEKYNGSTDNLVKITNYIYKNIKERQPSGNFLRQINN